MSQGACSGERLCTHSLFPSLGLSEEQPLGAPGWFSRLNVQLRLRSRSHPSEFEPRVRLCADSSKPGACFGSCVSLSLCYSPAFSFSLSLSLSKINRAYKNTNKNKKSSSSFCLLVLCPNGAVSRGTGSSAHFLNCTIRKVF